MSKARKDPSLHVHSAPAGYRLRGVSTLVDADGKVLQQWQKTAIDHNVIEDMILAFQEAIREANLPASLPTPSPERRDSELLAVYAMGDPHAGLLAWAPETGAGDFDLNIFRLRLVRVTQRLIETAPPAKNALIAVLGDTLHTDGYASTTAAGTRVDTDSRYPKILAVAIEALIRCTDLALEKHQHVTVVIAAGNHDTQSAVALRMCMAAHYRCEPRVTVDDSPAKFHYYRFGACLLGIHHGDTCKPKNLPGVMSTDRARAWGETIHRRWYVGHVHHNSVTEFPGVTVETFRTLAERDAWHTGQGYRSMRGAQVHVWHHRDGLVQRHEISR